MSVLLSGCSGSLEKERGTDENEASIDNEEDIIEKEVPTRISDEKSKENTPNLDEKSDHKWQEEAIKREEPQDVIEELAQEKIPTPSQTKGPYYPVQKPDDSDENLRLIQNSTERAEGTPIKVFWTLLDTKNNPQVWHLVEIRQTDNNGIYMHPNDPRVEQKDKNFQSYGETITKENWVFLFDTILPGYYDGRPRHIHLRVTDQKNQEQLSTQIYFHGDEELLQDNTFNQLQDKESVLLKLYEDPEQEISQLRWEIEIVVD